MRDLAHVLSVCTELPVRPNKYHPLFGKKELSVGFKRIFSGNLPPEIPSGYRENGLVYESGESGEEVIHLYEPAVIGSFGEIIFSPQKIGAEPVSAKLEFRKYVDSYSRGARPLWVAMARHPSAYHEELSCFGLDADPHKRRAENRSLYQSIEYPGLSQDFLDIFLKVVRSRSEETIYLKVSAPDVSRRIVVLADIVEKEAAPKILQELTPKW